MRAQPLEERLGVGLDEEHRPRRRAQDPLVDGVVEEPHETLVVAIEVEQRDGLAVHPELRPGEDLDDLLERPDAAGDGDEGVRQLGHERLALVHRPHDAQVLEALVRELARLELLGDDPGDAAARLGGRVGKDAHEPGAPAAVDDPDPLGGQQAREALGALRVGGARAGLRAGVEAHGPDRRHGKSSALITRARASV